MYKDFQAYLQNELNSIREAGLYKEERVIVTPRVPKSLSRTAPRLLTSAPTTTSDLPTARNW